MKKLLFILASLFLLPQFTYGRYSSDDDPGIIILTLIGVVWGILGIILFFKIWGMTNDVKNIKYYLELKTPEIYEGAEHDISADMTTRIKTTVSKEEDFSLDVYNLNPGDKVKVKGSQQTYEFCEFSEWDTVILKNERGKKTLYHISDIELI